MPEPTNPYASPTTDTEEVTQRQVDIRGLIPDGDRVFARRGAPFPDRCVICNAPVDGYRLWRHLKWHSPRAYFWLLFALIAYFLVAMATRREIVVEIGLCKTHRKGRWKGMLIWWTSALGGLGLAIASIAYDIRVGIFVGIAACLAGIHLAGRKGGVVYPTKITDEGAILKGCGPEFLFSLE